MTVEFNKNLSRRMLTLVKRGFFKNLSEDIEITRAISFKDLSQAYKLVYTSFLKLNYINSNSYEMRIRDYELDPKTATFIARKDNKVIGVTSVITSLNLPSYKLFKEELSFLEDRRVCEGTNWAISCKYKNSPILTELLRCCLAHSLHLKFNDFIAIISVSHIKFFEFLGFEKISDIKTYNGNSDKVALVRLDLDGLEERFKNAIGDELLFKNYYFNNNIYFSRVEKWEKLARRSFSRKLLLDEFLEIVKGI